jgi:hypothetical protein
MKKPSSYSPPWPDTTFHMDSYLKCIICHQTDLSMIVRGESKQGICESCSVIAHHMWRQAPGEAPPSFPDAAKTEVARVYVAIAKLSKTNLETDGTHSKSSPELPTSYDFAMVEREDDGSIDLPGTEVQPGEDHRAAVDRVLGSLKLATWPHPNFVEELYTAYTPRGRLATVYLVTVWRMQDKESLEDGLQWRHAPLSAQATSMGGFYRAMETVWKMRLHHHFITENHTDAICVRVSGAGASYIEMQRLLREGKRELDTSMVEIMRRNMSDDEKLIDKMIAAHAAKLAELRQEKSELAGSTALALRQTSPEDTVDEDDDVEQGSGDVEGVDSEESSSGGTGDDQDGEQDSGPEVDGADDDDSEQDIKDEDDTGLEEESEGPPPEGFARRGRKLSMKTPE